MTFQLSVKIDFTQPFGNQSPVTADIRHIIFVRVETQQRCDFVVR